MKPSITTQKELRRQFWEDHPGLDRSKQSDGDYKTDTRVAFVDYVDQMARSGFISDALARRANL